MHKGGGKGSFLLQLLGIDWCPLDLALIFPDRVKRISVWLPEWLYEDGEINIDIFKILFGPYAVCGEIGLYEFPNGRGFESRGGQQEGQAVPVNIENFRIYPNPAKGKIMLRFNLPDERKIAIKIYDVCGRVVYKKNIRESKIGMNEFLIRSEGLSSGIYFVQFKAGGYQAVKKVVLVQ